MNMEKEARMIEVTQIKGKRYRVEKVAMYKEQEKGTGLH